MSAQPAILAIALACLASCRRDAVPARRDPAAPRATDAAVARVVVTASPTPVLTPIPPDAASPGEVSPDAPTSPTPALDAETARIVTQARDASRRRDFRVACELIERALRHAPENPAVRSAARGVARDIEQAYSLTRTGPGFYRVVMTCVRQGVPVDLEIFS